MTTALQILSFISFALGVFCYGIRELQSHGKLKWMKGYKPFGFWGERSHERKYKINEGRLLQPRNPNWYYRFFNIKYTEAFLFSSNFLVAFTDGYHACQSAMFILFSIGISLLSGVNFFIIWCSLLVVNFVTYRVLQK